MSHQVTIDFEGLALSVQAQCETAAHSLCKIDKVLEKVHQEASKLESAKVKKYEDYLLKSKEEIQKKIDSFVESLEKYKALGTQRFDADARYGGPRGAELDAASRDLQTTIKQQGQDLENVVNELTGSRLAALDQLIDDGLIEAGAEADKKLLDKANGALDVSQEKLDKVNAIEDVTLRELAYRVLIKASNKDISFGEVIKTAQADYDVLLGKKTAKAIEECKEELRQNGLDAASLEGVKTIDEATKVVNDAITEEKVRKETLKIIIKAIKARGFIVDTKKNLKIDRDRNVLKLVALKASGQKAEFEIHINGKFMYHFDGYEGLACNKDITPFMKDLQDVYGIKVLHEEVQWSNPDKISTQKYQYVNKNKGTN